MSKWTRNQLLILLGFVALYLLLNVFTKQVSSILTFIDSFIPSSILLIFFTIIWIVWGLALLLLFQEKKGKALFVHKVWRIMPALLGILLFLTFVIFIILGVTVLSDTNQNIHWVIQLFAVYFIITFYLVVLSIFIRYGKVDTNKGIIVKSANTTVLLLIFVILFLPGI